MGARLGGHDGISVIPAKAGSMRRADHARAQSTYYAVVVHRHRARQAPDNLGFAEVIASYQLGLPGLLLLPLGRCSG